MVRRIAMGLEGSYGSGGLMRVTWRADTGQESKCGSHEGQLQVRRASAGRMKSSYGSGGQVRVTQGEAMGQEGKCGSHRGKLRVRIAAGHMEGRGQLHFNALCRISRLPAMSYLCSVMKYFDL